MSFSRATRASIVASILMLPLAGATASTPNFEAATFRTDAERAMAKMDAGMMTMPSGDVDKDFVAMMVPHHQGAIDMAIAELRYGHDEQLRRIAQEIIIDQQQEIAAMRLALSQPLPPSLPAPTQSVPQTPDHAVMPDGQEH